ncbi:MAG TPA: Fe-S cluster assembly protein SufD [Phycisphaerae bacterium]|nr:Fe-S cluster assembly protein SufD [Phycisphaerae bacterium]
MSTATQSPTCVEEFAAQFERLEKNDAFTQSWFHPLRKAALANFVENGFPTTKDEDWRFTNIRGATSTEWAAAADDAKSIAKDALAQYCIGEVAATFVFVDGRYADALSSTDGVSNGVVVKRLADALDSDSAQLKPYLGQILKQKNNAFALLNTAFVEDGVYVFVPKNAVLDKPIHIVYASTANDRPTVSHPRTLIVAEDNAQASVVESFVGIGSANSLTISVTELAVGPGANLFHHKIVEEALNAYHFGTIGAWLDRDSRCTSTNVCVDGKLTRNNVESYLKGEGGCCTFNGLSMLRDEQLVDNHLRIEHVAPHCESWQYFKGIYDGASHGVFAGRIYVHDDAQKTDAKQTNQSLLLSDKAQIDSKPQLEIFADDVKCTHGATIGQIDEEAVFYLRARGLNETAARNMLVHAFANETLEQIAIDPLRERLEAIVLDRLPKG